MLLLVCAARQLGTSVWRQAVCLFLVLMEDGTVRYTRDLVRGTLVVEKVGPFMAAFRAQYTMNFRLKFARHTSRCPSQLPTLQWKYFCKLRHLDTALLQKLIIICYSNSPHFIEYLQSLQQSQESTAAFHLEVKESRKELRSSVLLRS